METRQGDFLLQRFTKIRFSKIFNTNTAFLRILPCTTLTYNKRIFITSEKNFEIIFT